MVKCIVGAFAVPIVALYYYMPCCTCKDGKAWWGTGSGDADEDDKLLTDATVADAKADDDVKAAADAKSAADDDAKSAADDKSTADKKASDAAAVKAAADKKASDAAVAVAAAEAKDADDAEAAAEAKAAADAKAEADAEAKAAADAKAEADAEAKEAADKKIIADNKAAAAKAADAKAAADKKAAADAKAAAKAAADAKAAAAAKDVADAKAEADAKEAAEAKAAADAKAEAAAKSAAEAKAKADAKAAADAKVAAEIQAKIDAKAAAEAKIAADEKAKADARAAAATTFTDNETTDQDRHFFPGVYKFKTCAHEKGKMPRGWGLTNDRTDPDGVRNYASSWVIVHGKQDWCTNWNVVATDKPDIFKIFTEEHALTGTPAGHSLCALRDTVGKRSGISTKVCVHDRQVKPMLWSITPSDAPGGWKIRVANEDDSQFGWPLTAWGQGVPDVCRNEESSWVITHEASMFPTSSLGDWETEWWYERQNLR